MRDNVTLTNGRVVTHQPMANGAHDAVMQDGGLMSHAEWADYCAIVIARSRAACLASRAARTQETIHAHHHD
jgi:hypothetical protein